MQKSIQNLHSMKVNFRNRKALVNFPKDPNHKVLEHKESGSSLLNGTERKQKINLFTSPTKLIPTPNYERLDLDTSKSSYIDSIADTIHLIGQEYIAYLNEGKEERFKAAILSTLTNLEARDRKIIIEYDFTRNSEGKIVFEFQKQQQKFKEWLGQVHFRIVSTSFDFMINKMLTFTEIKVYCSENLLLNIILFIQKVENNILGISLTDFMMFVDNTLNENLEYLMVKYPQAKEMKANKRLREEVEPINNIQNDLHDILQHSEVQFKFNETANYNSEIMRFINYIIQIMTNEVTIDHGSKYSFANGFFESMENIFMSTYLPQSFDKDLQNRNLTLNQRKKQMALLFEDNKEVKEYKEKVMKYSSFKLGTKINPNTQLFTDSEIKAGFFQVKSTSILRILTKWIEELQKKIFQAKEYIQKRSFRFKNSKKSFSKLNTSQKNDLYLQATKQIQNLRQFIKEIRTNAFSIEGQLAMTINRNKVNIPKHEYVVGEFSSKLEDAASSSLLSYLNQLIHILLLIPKNTRERYTKDEELQKELEIELITFKISDLLRCKFSSHENQILRAYKDLKKLSDQNQNFKIVRIKDRLDLGTRDIMINISYQKKLLCEIQLAVTDEIDTKQQAYDAFNHYLYELKRSNLGAIMELACIWAHLDQRSRVYKKIKEKQIEEHYMSGTVKKVRHQCKDPVLFDNNLPFVCTVCLKFYNSQQGIIRHKKCKSCMKFYHCALCLENQMNEEQLKKFLGLDKILGIFVNDFAQWNGGQYPKNGLIIPKRNKTVQISFFTTVLWKQDAYIVRTVQPESEKDSIVDIMNIVKNNGYKQWKKLKENYFLYEWKQKRDVNLTRKSESKKLSQQTKKQLRKDQQKRKQQEKNKQTQEIKRKWKQKAQLIAKQLTEGVKNPQNNNNNQDNNTNNQSNNTNNQSNNTNNQSNKAQKMTEKESQKSKQPQSRPQPSEQKKLRKQKKQITSGPHKNTIGNNYQVLNQSIAKMSLQKESRVALKKIKNDNDQEVLNFLILEPYYKQSQIRAQLKKINNSKIIRQYLERKMEVLFLQDLILQNEIELQQKQIEKFNNSLGKITELYLDSNLLQQIKFLQQMPRLSVVHLNYNLIYKMQSLEKLYEITELMLEYNKIQQIQGLGKKDKLIELNLNHNTISSISGLEQVIKLEILSLGDNRIQKIQNLQNLTNLKKLDLSYNLLQNIQGLEALKNLEELDLSDNRINKIENLSNLQILKKLYLYKNKISKIQGLQKLKELKHLDLHHNKIQKIENLQNLKNLTHLNLGSNRIKMIEGLNQNKSLIELNLEQNFILSLESQRFKNLDSLRTLKLSYNGIRKLNYELIQKLPKLQNLFLNSNPIKTSKLQREVYKTLAHQLNKRSGFKFYLKNQEDETSDSDSSDDQKTKQQKIKRIQNKN